MRTAATTDSAINPSPSHRRTAGLVAGTALLAALTLTGCPGPDAGSEDDPPPDSAAVDAGEALEEAYQEVIDQVLPSVVEIRSSSGTGSGVVLNGDGDIVTNAHVVGDEQEFQVFASGSAEAMEATLVGSYPPNDLAVVRVTDGEALPPATFADSSEVEVGQIVLAMGNPLGLQATVTSGIVSATGRTVSEPPSEQSPGATLPGAIQTSADINPGNSGGALVNLQAEVVGIPTLAALSPQTGGAAPGIGFAIPSNQATSIGGQLAENGEVTDSGRAALGVGVRTVADGSGKPVGVGVVEVVPGGPADDAGIRPGDVIVEVDGQPTPTTEALGAVLAELEPQQQVPVRVLRGGDEEEVEVTLGEL
jgi:S1-C subfamily serine protease